MKKHLIKRISIIIGSLIGLIIIASMIVPLFILVSPIEGLSTTKQLSMNESNFISIPFDGTDGIDIHYIESGETRAEEPVFILLHGSMYNSFTWNKVINSFGEIGRTIAYDQIPYGLSEKLLRGDWEKDNPYTPDAAIQQLITFLDVLNLKKVYLVGSSYGGTLAVKAALENPERVSGLILVDPAIFVNESMPSWLVNSKQMDNIGPYLARSIGTGMAFYESCYYDSSIFTGDRKDKTMITTEIENWDIALWQYLKAWGTNPIDLESRLSEIDTPTLIIYGSDDKIVPPEDSQKLNELLPNSTMKMIQETGHLPHEESPDEFEESIIPWIKSQI